MYLSAERLAVANQAVQETFQQTSIAWQAIPHWDTGDPGQVRVRKDLMYNPPNSTVAAQQEDADDIECPLLGESVELTTETVRFYVTVAQACAPTPDALLAAAMSWTAKLAGNVDYIVFPELYAAVEADERVSPSQTDPQSLLDALIDARALVEKAGYRAPSCLVTDTEGLKKLSYLEGAEPVAPYLLSAANINSLHRAEKIKKSEETTPSPSTAQSGKTTEGAETTQSAEKTQSGGQTQAPADNNSFQMILLGRRQRIAHGGAAEASPGEEPVDLAVSVPPSLEVVGETATGYIELAVRIRFATRTKDVRGISVIEFPEPAS
jgi:hypothetical protein